MECYLDLISGLKSVEACYGNVGVNIFGLL